MTLFKKSGKNVEKGGKPVQETSLQATCYTAMLATLVLFFDVFRKVWNSNYRAVSPALGTYSRDKNHYKQ
eukprot:6461837-Amphidinium_carterae.1